MKAGKRYLALIIFIFFANNGFAQCIAFAGNDTALCAGDVVILSNASVTGGTPPYTYQWNIWPIMGGTTLADYFDDSTALHPTIGLRPTGSFSNYSIVVTDSNGITCTDTIRIFYHYLHVVLSSDTNIINAGDSVQLNANGIGAYPPFTYQWEPSSSLTQSDITNPIAFPSVTTNYTLTITDSTGCTRDFIISIIVGGVGIESLSSSSFHFDIFPNPAPHHLNITTTLPNHAAVNYEIFTVLGETVVSENNTADAFSVDVSALTAGVYFIRLNIGNASVVKRWVKE